MKHLVLATALAGIFVVSPGNSLACFVVAPDVPEAFESAQAVFIGEVVEITKPLTSEPDAPVADRFYRVTFKVEYSWKGAGFHEFGVSKIVILSNQGMAGSCFSWGAFSEGRKYLVYAEETAEKNLVVQVGNRTASLSNASEDLQELEKMSNPFFKFQYKRVRFWSGYSHRAHNKRLQPTPR
ncbi:MAG: hypothetical protein ACREBG_14060 [Pyrinomonadaceae bacterium]